MNPGCHIRLAALALAAMTVAPCARATSELPMDGFAAVVNEKIITIGDVMLSINEAQERLRLRYSGEELEARRRELFQAGLDRLVEQALIIEEFKTQQAQIPERAIDDQINEIVFKNFNNDKAALLAALARDGTTLEEWRESIRERIIVSAMRRTAIYDRIVISPRQILDAYDASQSRYQQPEQVRIRMIFVAMADNSEAAFETIAAARAEIVDGKPFEDVARSVSQDATASIGGDWGLIAPGELRAELRDAVTPLAPGDVSEPVFTPEGYYLIKLEERREAYTKSLEDVRTEIENELREQEAERLYREWVQRLRNKHSVLYYVPRPDSQP